MQFSGRAAVPISWEGPDDTARRLSELGCCAWLGEPCRAASVGRFPAIGGAALDLAARGETRPGSERVFDRDSTLENPQRTSGSPAVFRLDSQPNSSFSPTDDFHPGLLDEPASGPDGPMAEPPVAGGVVVSSDSPGGQPHFLSAAQLAEDAGRLVDSVREEKPSQRAITVHSAPLDRPAARQLLAWASYCGAALVIEPNQAAFVATVAWARPTVVAVGQNAEAAQLCQWAQRSTAGGRWRRKRRPFGRLRALLVAPELDLAEADRDFWAQHEVRVIQLGGQGRSAGG